MIVFIHLICIVFLVLICIDDFRNREVWNYQIVIIGILGSWVFYYKTNIIYYLFSILSNYLILAAILLTIFMVGKFFLKKKFNDAFGIGDLYFYVAFASSFPTLSFLNLFTFSILFTLALFLLLRKRMNFDENGIPLAGSLAGFLGAVYILNLLGLYQNLYLH